MGMLMPLVLQLAKLCIIGFALIVHGSSGLNTSPSPAKLSVFAPTEGIPSAVEQRSDAPGMVSQPNGSGLHSPPALPPLLSAPVPETTEGHANSSSPSNSIEPSSHDTTPPPFSIEGHIPSLAPSSRVVLPPPHDMAPPPFMAEGGVPSLAPSRTVGLPPPIGTVSPPLPVQVHTPSKSPTASQAKEPITPVASPSSNLPQISPAINPSPIQPPLRNSPQNPPAAHFNKTDALPPSANQGNSSNDRAPVMDPVAPAPVATPSGNSPTNQTDIHARVPNVSPPSAPIPGPTTPVASPPRKLERTPPPVHSIMPPSILPVPVVPPPGESPHNLPIINPNVTRGTPSQLPDPDVSPVSTPTSSNNWKNKGIPVASPKNKMHKPFPPVSHAPEKGSSSAISPSAPKAMGHHKNSPVPSLVPSNNNHNPPALSPSILFHKHTRHGRINPAPAPSYLISPPPMKQPGPVISPEFPPGRRHRHYAPAPLHSVSPSRSDIPSSVPTVSPNSSPSPVPASRQTKKPLISPKGSPSVAPLRSPKVPPPPLVMSFPPPPPNEDCSKTVCTEPYTNTPPGAPCGCVLPMQVGLRLSVALYTFFPLVSELAAEIAVGVFMKQSQVRIMGANAASEQPEKTLVLIDLVPLGKKFDKTTALLTFQRFWHKQVAVNTSLFGDYEVLYVRYLGLPPSPPLPPDVGIIDAGPYPGNDNNARAVKPLGVDVHVKRHRSVLNGGMIAIIVLSALVALVLCSSIAWVLVFKHRGQASQQGATQPLQTSLAKPSGSAGSMLGSGLSSTSLSLSSSIVAFTGTAKTFTATDIEKATANFDDSRILGEGGFGRVYSGILDDDTKVAVKVLKRDDQQGGREFLAEVEMLSRLHHRNLVKLIGICIEERMRCLVYELIPNGSVESHLHGVDKESAPLDWVARIKIALGAARGLAYLHEDSSPRVIHRDFKSSNILLEHDFTPKVSDFGLARTAMDEEGRHISTRVMGTFGYVAPEYAMTGHLLVKSDVYSYGVVLLELLTGRKPVDMTQPPGQENLVAWARPLLTTKEGLETIIDPSLGCDIPFDSVAKVAAIASMCVQPEVSHRPFMGEVVQALKLVCNECDEAKAGSRGSSHDNLSIDLDGKDSPGSGRLTDPLRSHYLVPNYDSCHDSERGLSVSDLFSSSARLGRESSGSFRRHCSSGPLRTGKGSRFWQKMHRLSRGSISEHGPMIKFWPGSH